MTVSSMTGEREAQLGCVSVVVVGSRHDDDDDDIGYQLTCVTGLLHESLWPL